MKRYSKSDDLQLSRNELLTFIELMAFRGLLEVFCMSTLGNEAKVTLELVLFQQNKECVAVLTVLYKKNGAAFHFIIPVGKLPSFLGSVSSIKCCTLAIFATLLHRKNKPHLPWYAVR